MVSEAFGHRKGKCGVTCFLRTSEQGPSGNGSYDGNICQWENKYRETSGNHALYGGKNTCKNTALALAVQQPPKKNHKMPNSWNEIMEGNIFVRSWKHFWASFSARDLLQQTSTKPLNESMESKESKVASSAFCLGLWVSPKFELKFWSRLKMTS